MTKGHHETESDPKPQTATPTSGRATRAKLRVNKKQAVDGGFSIYMTPVVGGEGNADNDAFYAATPGGSIQLSVIKGDQADVFVEGKTVFVTFTAAD